MVVEPMKWVRKGQEQAPKVERPSRPTALQDHVEKIVGHPKTLPPEKPSCTDCGSTTRKLTRVSPKVMLCATDIRNRRNARRETSRARRVVRVYDISLGEKDLLIQFQGGGCICMEWTGYNGNTRALSIDHDHKTGVVRGALCKHCNDLLGRVRDDPRYFIRMIAYLENPPAVRLFGERIAPEN